MSGPLAMVAAAISDGAASRTALAERTGLARDVVDAALEHLQRMGRISAEQLSSGCPDGGCRACPSGKADGGAGCGTTSRGPVMLKLVTRS